MTTTVYLLKNLNNEYFNKAGEWTASPEQKFLYRSAYKDEAINQKVELTVKCPELRINIIEAISDNGVIKIQQAPAEHCEKTFRPDTGYSSKSQAFEALERSAESNTIAWKDQ